jgi:type IX secretion system PorP/SprF family membrane protein
VIHPYEVSETYLIMNLKIVLSLVLFVSCLSQVVAQDPQFTQFYAAPVYLNPAFAGSQKCPRIVMNYRNQWPSLPGTFVTYSASYDQHVDNLQGGLGLMVMSDKAGEGTINTTNVSGIYSFLLNVSRKFSIKTGFQATYVQKRLDWDKLTFGDMIDPRYGFVYSTQETRPNESRSYIDMAAGIVGYTSQFYGGFAVHHLTEPDEAFIVQNSSKLPMKMTAHAGALIPLVETRYTSSYISPNILYQQQADFNQLNLGVYVSQSPIVGGLWFRGNFAKDEFFTKESLIALIGLQQGIFKFGYSYDVTISKLGNATGGSHELSFGMQFECRPKKKRFRTISCPSF